MEIHELRKISILDPIFDSDILVLMVEVFPPLRKAHRWKSLQVEGIVVSAAEITV
jgi:hypothetical protein